MSTPSLAEAMQIYAERVVSIAQEEHGVHLDYSEQSIAAIEQIMDALYERQLDHVQSRLRPIYPNLSRAEIASLIRDEPPTEDIQRTSAYFGAYVGEVIRRHWGGTWTTESQFSTNPTYTLILPDSSEVYPLNKICKRLLNGGEDNIKLYYQMVKLDLSKAGKIQE